VSHTGSSFETLRGNLVKISISDTGLGVPETERPYLFSKFSRGKDTSRLHVGGTGLGLYVGKNIIEAQHGRIYVESEGAGKGSKFIVELPIVQPKG
jgi:signal transduction histidine kinase